MHTDRNEFFSTELDAPYLQENAIQTEWGIKLTVVN